VYCVVQQHALRCTPVLLHTLTAQYSSIDPKLIRYRYLQGDVTDVVGRAVRVIVCGNSVAPPPVAAAVSQSSNGITKLTPEQQREAAAPLRECDAELAQVYTHVKVLIQAHFNSNKSFLLVDVLQAYVPLLQYCVSV
jgi:hypothetical protein